MRYTDKELEVICKEVTNHPTNLSLAFRNASQRLGRSEKGIMQKYYNSLRDSNILFMVASKNNMTHNVKNSVVKTKKSKKKKLSLWDRILKLFK